MLETQSLGSQKEPYNFEPKRGGLGISTTDKPLTCENALSAKNLLTRSGRRTSTGHSRVDVWGAETPN
jgi:hypothetical protein